MKRERKKRGGSRVSHLVKGVHEGLLANLLLPHRQAGLHLPLLRLDPPLLLLQLHSQRRNLGGHVGHRVRAGRGRRDGMLLLGGRLSSDLGPFLGRRGRRSVARCGLLHEVDVDGVARGAQLGKAHRPGVLLRVVPDVRPHPDDGLVNFFHHVVAPRLGLGQRLVAHVSGHDAGRGRRDGVATEDGRRAELALDGGGSRGGAARAGGSSPGLVVGGRRRRAAATVVVVRVLLVAVVPVAELDRRLEVAVFPPDRRSL